MIDEKFEQFVKDIESGKELLNEGVLPTPLVNSLVRQASWSLSPSSSVCSTLSIGQPTLEGISSAMGVKYEDNVMDNKVVVAAYEKVLAAFNKAKLEFLNVLNKELKSI
jgi:hypothetical protein